MAAGRCSGPAIFLALSVTTGLIAVVMAQEQPLCGNSTESGNILVEVPSVIYSPEMVQFNCSLVGGATATYRWWRNSQLLPGGSDGSLLVAVTLEWAGSCLTCEVLQTGENVSQTLQVIDASPQVSIVQAPVVTVDTGDTLLLTCEATGRPPLMARWLHGGVSLGVPGLEYEENAVMRSDAGEYTCQVVNSVTTGTARVDVLVRYAPVIEVGPVDTDAVNASDLLLNCSASGQPTPTITWYRGELGMPITARPGGRVQVLANGSLYIDPVSLMDTGTYICNASNSLGTAQADSAMVMVQIFPAFDHVPTDVTVLYQESVTLQCVAMGLPQVSYQWLRQIGGGVTVPVTLDNRVTVTEGNLTIATVRREDAGVYSCNVSNELGSISARATIIVRAPPLSPSGLQVSESGSSWIVLSWLTSDGASDYTVEYRLTFDPTWSNTSTPISTVNITTLYPNATYQVRVIASSVYGRSPPGSELLVATLSGVPLPDLEDRAELTHVVAMTSRAISVSWTVPQVLLQTSVVGSHATIHDISGGGRGLLAETMQLPGNTFNYTFINLMPFTLYQVGVALQFVGGEIGVAVVANVTTLEDVPGDPPTQLSISVAPPTDLLVSWATPTLSNGIVTSYTVYFTSPNIMTVVVPGHASSYDLVAFQPFTNYTVTVSANTSVGEGPRATPITFLTPQAPPPPPDGLEVTMLNFSTALVAWQPYSGHVPGIVVYYIVQYKPRLPDVVYANVTVAPDRYSVELRGLLPFVNYVVAVAAATQAGQGNFSVPYIFTTLPYISMWVADNLLVLEQCPSSDLLLSWEPPRPHLLGGAPDSVQYVLSYRRVNGSEINITVPYGNGSVPVQSYLLGGLVPYSEYEVRLALSNDNGTSSFTPWTLNMTCDAQATPPSNVTARAINSTAVSVMWEAPPTVRGTLLGYQLRYRETGSSAEYTVIQTSSSAHVVDQLKPYTLYSVGVASVTRGPEGLFSQVDVRTHGDVPVTVVMGVAIEGVCPSSLNVAWTPVSVSDLRGPDHASYYLITYSTTNSSLQGQEVSVTTPYLAGNSVVLTGLLPRSEYVVRVRVNGSYGLGPLNNATIGTTLDGVPSAPTEVEMLSVGVVSMTIRWRPPQHPRGQVQYCVAYSSKTTPTHSSETTPTPQACTNSTSIVLSDLRPFTLYRVSVVAMTMCGMSEAVTVTNETLPTLPGPPLQVVVVTRLPYSVHLSWMATDEPNGLILHYNVYCGGERSEVRVPRADCTGLRPNTNYTVGVATVNMVGESSNVTVTTTTTCQPPTLDFVDNSISVATTQCSHRFVVEYVLVLVQELTTYSNGSYLPATTPLDSYSLHQLQLSTSAHAQSRSRRQVNQEGVVYIAANLTQEQFMADFILGDNQQYGGYSNFPLTSGIRYQVGYRGTVPGTDTPLFLSAPEPVVYVSLSESTSSSRRVPSSSATPTQDSLPFPLIPVAIAGGIGLLLLLLIAMAGCISCLCCCYTRSPDKDEAIPLQRQRLSSFRLSEKKKPLDPVQYLRVNKHTEALEDHAPVPVEGFVNRLMVMRTNDNQLFLEEFGSIAMVMTGMPRDVANNPSNKTKNRYYNIVPYDATRVKVKGHNSDYINASYCAGYRRQKAYIATQGPLPSTVSDFWRMVLDDGVRTLVMLTKTQEKGKVKCERYWPGGDVGSSVTHGSVEVTLSDCTVLADYTVRTLQLHKVGSNKDGREVVQFHFTSWPDHGVPEYATAMLSMIRRVRAHYSDMCASEGPMLVHCSAGVGRTGTFIVIDSMLQRLAQGEELIDIYGHVSLLRTQRSDMVQTEDQYFFIHEAVAEALLCGNTEVPVDHLPGYVADLCKSETESDRTGLELEFKRLALERNSPHRWTVANKDANKTKNRFVNVLPYDSSRVVLERCPGVDGSDYINASHVDSYRSRRAFIACQGPLQNTVVDFWRMVWEHSVSVIVMLTELQERGHECSAAYWPDVPFQPMVFGQYQVELNVQRTSSTYTYRDFSITSMTSGEKRLLLHFQFHAWPEVGVPQPLPLTDFLREVQKLCESISSPGPTLVHCSNGVGRTGVFISLHILLERVMAEGLVDVFQTVKNLRIQRPAIVQTLEQYHFCYDTVVHFVQTSESVGVALTRLRRASTSSFQRHGSKRGSSRRSRSSDSRKKTSPSLSPVRAASFNKTGPSHQHPSPHKGPEREGAVQGGGVVQPVDLVTTEVSQMYGGSDATSTFGPRSSLSLSQDQEPVQQVGVASTPAGSVHAPSLNSTPLAPRTSEMNGHSVSNGSTATPPLNVPSAHGNYQNGPYAPDVSPGPPNLAPYTSTPLSMSYAHNGSPITHPATAHTPANSSHLLISSSVPASSAANVSDDPLTQLLDNYQLHDTTTPTGSTSYQAYNSQGESTQL